MLQPALFRILYTGISFLANLMLANILMPSVFGNLTLMILNASMLSLISGFGTDTIILHSLVNKKWNISQGFIATLSTLALQIVLFLIFEAASLLIFERTLLSHNNLQYLAIEMFYFLGLIFTEKYSLLLYSRNKALITNILLAIATTFYLLLLLLIKSSNTLSYYYVISFFSIYSFLQGCILIIFFHLKNKLPVIHKKKWFSLKSNLKLSSIVMVTNIIQLIAYRIDFWLIEYFHTSYEVGIYAQANKFANLMWVIPNILAFLLITKFSQIEKDKIPSVFKFSFISSLFLLLITIVITNILYNYFLESQYFKGLHSFYFMLPGYFCWSVVIYFGAYFSWLGKFHYNLIASTFCFVVIFISDYLLIPRLEINGAAISNSIAYSFTLFLYLFLFSKETGNKVINILKPNSGDILFILKKLR
jgi:O-antigen/teichoic acid export membrane protein